MIIAQANLFYAVTPDWEIDPILVSLIQAKSGIPQGKYLSSYIVYVCMDTL